MKNAVKQSFQLQWSSHLGSEHPNSYPSENHLCKLQTDLSEKNYEVLVHMGERVQYPLLHCQSRHLSQISLLSSHLWWLFIHGPAGPVQDIYKSKTIYPKRLVAFAIWIQTMFAIHVPQLTRPQCTNIPLQECSKANSLESVEGQQNKEYILDTAPKPILMRAWKTTTLHFMLPIS